MLDIDISSQKRIIKNKPTLKDRSWQDQANTYGSTISLLSEYVDTFPIFHTHVQDITSVAPDVNMHIQT